MTSILPEGPLANETFNHRFGARLSDNLILKQLKEQEEAKRDEALQAASLEEVLSAE